MKEKEQLVADMADNSEMVELKVKYTMVRHFGVDSFDRELNFEIGVDLFYALDFRERLVRYLIHTANYFGYDTVTNVGYEVVSKEE